MLREQFSYWLAVSSDWGTVAPDSADDVRRAVKPACLVPDDEEREDDVLRFQVDPDLGTTEQWTEMEDVLLTLSRAHPDLTIHVREVGESDKSLQRALRVRDGRVLLDNRARLVEADSPWDDVTVRAVVAALRNDFHMDEIAGFIADRFRNPPWPY